MLDYNVAAIIIRLHNKAHLVYLCIVAVLKVDPKHCVVISQPVANRTHILLRQLAERQVHMFEGAVFLEDAPPLPGCFGAVELVGNGGGVVFECLLGAELL